MKIKTISIISALLIQLISSEASAENLLCSNSGIIDNEIVQLVSSYDDNMNHKAVAVEGSQSEKIDKAFFLITSSEVGELYGCIYGYDIRPDLAESAIREQWDRVSNPPEKNVGDVTDEGRLYDLKGKLIFIQAAKGDPTISVVTIIAMAAGGRPNYCLLNETCISKVRMMLND